MTTETKRSAKYDPDTIAALEDELDQQLRSLDDLDAEYDAGDMDKGDYETLRDDYTIRVADTMRRLKQQQDLVTGRPGRRVNPMALAAIIVFAVGAGWLLARSTGERGVGDLLTGDIVSSRQRIFDCQDMAQNGDIVDALQCLDGVLLQDPENVEALTYRGWYLILTTGSAADQEQTAGLLDTGMTYLDQAVDVDPDFPDARAFRSVVFDRLGQSEAACQELQILLSLNPPPFFVTQTSDIAARNNCT